MALSFSRVVLGTRRVCASCGASYSTSAGASLHVRHVGRTDRWITVYALRHCDACDGTVYARRPDAAHVYGTPADAAGINAF